MDMHRFIQNENGVLKVLLYSSDDPVNNVLDMEHIRQMRDKNIMPDILVESPAMSGEWHGHVLPGARISGTQLVTGKGFTAKVYGTLELYGPHQGYVRNWLDNPNVVLEVVGDPAWALLSIHPVNKSEN
jgi:hypothetical protein